jgi:membrane-associated HD superfamily phosphohydrolase
MKRINVMIAILGLTMIIVGCETRDRTVGERTAATGDTIGAQTGRTVGEAREWTEERWNTSVADLRNFSYDRRDDFKDRAEEMVDHLEDRFNDVKNGRHMSSQTATGHDTTTATAPLPDRTANEIELKIKEARDNINRLGEAEQSNWNTVRDDVEKSLTELKQLFDQHNISIANPPERMNNGTRGY